MKTIKDTGPQLIAMHTRESRPAIAPGKVRITFVRYSVVEYSKAELQEMKEGKFQIHDANCEEAKIIADLVKS